MNNYSFGTVYDLVKYVENNYSNPNAFNYYSNGHWHGLSTEAFIYDLKRMTYGLISKGIKPGDHVGILANPSPYWTMIDFAIIIVGAISVPLFPNISDENFVYEVAQAGIRHLFIEGKDQWEVFNRHRNLFDFVCSLDPSVEYERVTSLHQFLKAGESLWEMQPGLFDSMGEKLKPEDTMSIVYTSGVTGVPKGVELTQKNLLHLTPFNFYGWDRKKDTYLSILPLAHVFARQINFVIVGGGVSVYYLNDRNVFQKVCKELKPSMMIVVPRVLEKMYFAIDAAKDKGSSLKRKIVSWALRLAHRESVNPLVNYIARPIANFLVYTPIRKEFGDNWLFILSGGARLDPNLSLFFHHIGIPIYEGWGLTEGSTPCVNRPGLNKIGTVGTPLPEVKIKISDEGEVLLGGPTVMKRYFRNPEITEETIDKEGWLHTGDQGEIDEEGFLKITGRIKEHFKLATGEWLIPGRIEFALSQSPFVDTAVVIGERRQFAAAFLFPDFNTIRKIKAQLSLTYMSDEEFLQSDLVKKEIKSLLDLVNSQVNFWERIKQYRFIMEPLTIENGEITPNLKVKREAVLQKYASLVDEIYKEKPVK